jgi:hypothetical protein
LTRQVSYLGDIGDEAWPAEETQGQTKRKCSHQGKPPVDRTGI